MSKAILQGFKFDPHNLTQGFLLTRFMSWVCFLVCENDGKHRGPEEWELQLSIHCRLGTASTGALGCAGYVHPCCCQHRGERQPPLCSGLNLSKNAGQTLDQNRAHLAQVRRACACMRNESYKM
eukprot:1702539-Amphidinium_carterae.1